jgi:hypothetical protein
MNNVFPDAIIYKEMELPLKRLFKEKEWGEEFMNSIPNISFRSRNTIVETLRIESELDINELPIPDRKLLDIEDYIDVRTMLSSR